MIEIDWEKRMNGLRQQLTLIKGRAFKDSARFQELWKQTEYTKVQLLAHQLEARRKHLARSRGVVSIVENKKGLPVALGAAAVASILTGIITKDGNAAANAGVKGLSGTLQGLGETEWVVCLEQNLAVAPWDNIRREGVWVTWDSFKTALRELEELAKNGAHLGNLDNIIYKLKKSRKILLVIKPPTGGTTVQF